MVTMSMAKTVPLSTEVFCPFMEEVSVSSVSGGASDAEQTLPVAITSYKSHSHASV